MIMSHLCLDSRFLIKDDVKNITHECDLRSLWAAVGKAYQRGESFQCILGWVREKKEHFLSSEKKRGNAAWSRRNCWQQGNLTTDAKPLQQQHSQ